jgi:ATP-binding protein involved in chromosome partitioning
MDVVEIPDDHPDDQIVGSEDGMALTEDRVLEALRPVQDPELHMSIVELDMVKSIRIKRGHVTVTVALTVAGCPMQPEITQRVTDALRPVEGVADTSVELTVMSEQELTAVREKMRARSGAPAGHAHGGQRLGHEEGRPNPFMDSSSRTRILGISSGKGGVGKSSVSVNLAVALVQQGYEVGILDADVYGFSVPKMLGIDHDPVVIEDMNWGDLDFLIVDMPPGTGDVALSMAQYLPRSEVYVVTTPQPAAQRVAQRTAYMAKKINLPLRGVIENMSWFTGDDGRRYPLFGQGGGQLLASDLGVPLLGQIPLFPALREGGDEGRPVTATDKDSEVAQAFATLAAEVVARGPSRVFRPELTIR